ncbi:MAG: tRNA epoxyqueuosine(34) reductase QueG, partial [bacterium]|nr:tRNA epoxyqueuosine(34) reductase QueG [bacterium]
MSPTELTAKVKALTTEQGFRITGIAPAQPLERSAYLHQWLAQGRHGRMAYLARNLANRLDPRRMLPGARSIVVVAHPYRQPENAPPDNRPRGRVAMYAWGPDYHEVVKRRLHAVCDRLHDDLSDPFRTRVCVDTAPIIERDLAAQAGVGWIGKNTMTIDPGLGSYFFLGIIITTLELVPDAPIGDHCGTCTRCLDACPTGALPAAYQMDASRCISYLTIELRDAVPEEYHAAMGDWIFGCDICQEVCPYNQKSSAEAAPDYAVRPPAPRPALEEIAGWTEDDYRASLA